MVTKEAVDATGRTQRVVLAAIGDLRAAGLVTVDGERYAIDTAALREAARAAADLDVPMDPIIGLGMTAEEQTILRRYFSGRTLTEIPASRAKRQTLTEQLRQETLPPRAERRADTQLALTHGAASEEQVRHVHARDQQHEQDGASQNEQRRSDWLHDLLVDGYEDG